jgi:glycerol dehydrogenase
MSRRVFGAPSRLYLGNGIFDELGAIVGAIGRKPGILIDGLIEAMLRGRLTAAFAKTVNPIVRPFAGEVTRQNIELAAAPFAGCDVIIGIGGGKTIDAGKGIAVKLGLPIVTVPTIASNDSPTSSAIAIYDDEHRMVAVDRMAWNPAAVVVDTGIILRAPRRFLVAGIGDAVAKKFEADACAVGSGLTMFGTRPLAIGGIIADGCYRQILQYAAAGLRDASEGLVTPAFEAIVEAVILLSGVGFENGGLSIAHAMTRGLMQARHARNALHGEHVAYGLRVHMVLLEGQAKAAAELKRLYLRIGLPLCLADLGMRDASFAEMTAIAEIAFTAQHIFNFPMRLEAPMLAAAMLRLESEEARR